MKAIAPAKLILSGEHAIVYGYPALAMAVNRYATASITRDRHPQILFDLANLAQQRRLSLTALSHLKNRIKRKYQKFINGEYSIRQVLQKPFELAQFALSTVADKLNVSLPHGVKIHVESDIPVGCGMGSSAATILSVMHAISHYMQLPLSSELLFQLALEAEHMQHGKSSGLDLRVSMQGGCLWVEGDQMIARPIPTIPMYLVQTGEPRSSTGECVAQVAQHFRTTSIGDEFAHVTRAMNEILDSTDRLAWIPLLRANHRLLVRIGVVPEKLQSFIQAIEDQGGAAKICGAGTVVGEAAGVVLVLLEEQALLHQLCEQYHYQVMSMTAEPRGVYVV